ncbi:hypothetical protein RISK_002967 [Rhodopirellula islandica]|uniref:Uncharacterized protein n=1 Tax=Rhodopirellula islandica TaxID=595434 RepID=A0A0J1EHI5_RHOIS|nr:hypothetical protein RISK_002967 [Rhodopirellula islandica]
MGACGCGGFPSGVDGWGAHRTGSVPGDHLAAATNCRRSAT